MKIQDFYNNFYINYAAYDAYRSISSYVDGLKPTSRKIIFTLKTNNYKKNEKVINLAADVARKTEYIHGNVSIEGVIVNLAKNYPGSNNINLLIPDGNFGDRLKPEPGASRYIYTNKNKILDIIFPEIDDNFIENQIFEGKKIEPKCYFPIIPIILVNGAEGIAKGFYQKILPRDPSDIIKYIKQYLNTGKLPWNILPYYKGIDCKIKKDENSYLIYGKIKRGKGRNKNLVTIIELPPKYDYDKYIKKLNSLLENKTILNYKDLCDKKVFKFEVKLNPQKFKNSTEDEILNALKLIQKETEIFVCLDENNKLITKFNSEIDILKAFIDLRLKIYGKRKEYILNNLIEKFNWYYNKLLFIKNIINEKIVIQNKTKNNIFNQMKKVKIDEKYFDKLLSMKLYSLEKSEISKLKKKLIELEKEIKKVKKTSEKEFYFNDLEKLEKINKN